MRKSKGLNNSKGDFEGKWETFKYIPYDLALELNQKAKEAGKKRIKQYRLETHVVDERRNLPIESAFHSCAGRDWVRCVVLVGFHGVGYCPAFLDLRKADFDALPAKTFPLMVPPGSSGFTRSFLRVFLD